jgi:hypothetical protein
VDIRDEDELYRRLIPFSVQDGRVTSAAFYDRRGKPDPSISVNLARLSTLEETLSQGPLGFGVGVLQAGTPRSIGLSVRHAPEADNEANALIEGATSKEHCRALARATRIEVPPVPQDS